MSTLNGPDHVRYMRAALALAQRGLGRTWPNPTVGCVLVKDGRIIARGRTQNGGRPHAEVMALRAAGGEAAGATAYVTLEPCSHYGKTPPCCDALIAAGVSTVVMALEDTDPRVAGRGRRRLEEAGIRVVGGICADEARELNAGFFSKVERGRPLFTLKLATSLDARSALSDGTSQWITGPQARAFGHLLRADHDAILIGSGTARADDPSLTCRLPGLGARTPQRIVLNRTGDLSPDLSMFHDGNGAVWQVVAQGRRPTPAAETEIVSVPETDTGINLNALAAELGNRGVTRVLVESGGALAASLIAAGLIDRVAWFTASSVIGGDGHAAIGALGLKSLTSQPRYRLSGHRRLGADSLYLFEAVSEFGTAS